MDQFDISEEEQKKIDAYFEDLDHEVTDLPMGWTMFSIAVPRDFLHILSETHAAYKRATGSDKDFPAFEAMIMEAKNSLGDLE